MVVRFFQLADSARADVTEGGVLYEGSKDPEDFRDAACILETAIQLGKAFVSVKPWWLSWLPWT